MALQRQRRKRNRGKSEDDDRVIRLEGQQRSQQDGRREGDERERDQEDRQHDEDEEPRQQEEGSQAEEDQGREPEDREPSSEDESRDERDEDKDREDRRSEPLPALEILDAAKDQLTVLTGRIPDSVSGLRRSDNGWRMKIDMVELERIPPSTSVMATYEVELDRDGNVIGYEQERRFVRGQAED